MSSWGLQGALKSAPRATKSDQRAQQERPRPPKDRPRPFQERPRALKERIKWDGNGQGRSKTAPRAHFGILLFAAGKPRFLLSQASQRSQGSFYSAKKALKSAPRGPSSALKGVPRGHEDRPKALKDRQRAPQEQSKSAPRELKES